MIIKKIVAEAFKGTMSETTTTIKAFFQDIEKRFVKNEKIGISTLFARLVSMRYSSNG